MPKQTDTDFAYMDVNSLLKMGYHVETEVHNLTLKELLKIEYYQIEIEFHKLPLKKPYKKVLGERGGV